MGLDPSLGQLRETLQVAEFMLLLEPSGLLAPDLSHTQLLEAVGMTMLGADNTELDEWMEVVTADPTCQVMIFSEFIDSLARAAFTKYRDDDVASPELKTHEFCQVALPTPPTPRSSFRNVHHARQRLPTPAHS